MKFLNVLALSTLITPAIALGAGTVLAQQSNGQDPGREQPGTQREQDSGQSPRLVTQDPQGEESTREVDTQAGGDQRKMHDQTRMQYRGYLASSPVRGLQASELLGTEVRTNSEDLAGLVNDLIIDEHGQVVAIVIDLDDAVGAGDKDIAIGWDDVMKSGTSENQELLIDVTREDLQSATAFKRRN